MGVMEWKRGCGCVRQLVNLGSACTSRGQGVWTWWTWWWWWMCVFCMACVMQGGQPARAATECVARLRFVSGVCWGELPGLMFMSREICMVSTRCQRTFIYSPQCPPLKCNARPTNGRWDGFQCLRRCAHRNTKTGREQERK